MAEATDRPQTPGQVSPDAVMPEEQLGAVTPAAAETYQPLSLLALAGFGLAVIYSVVVLIGAAVALFGRVPWLMPYWTFLIPLAALVICWAARTRIRDSESTLSGLAFTTWGSRLAILVGITYASYYVFTFFAVRFQAVAFADSFFQQIKQGELEKAFLMTQGMTLKDMSKASKEDLRNQVESRFNQTRGRPGSVGPYTRFCQDDFVRFLEMGGDKAEITPRGVAEWEHRQDGYRLMLNYHLRTPIVEFDVKIETFGSDPKPGEPKGRKWQLNFANGLVTNVPDSQKWTPQGGEFRRKTMTANNFVTAWVGKIDQAQWKEAYLDTLPPSERERRRKELKTAQFEARGELAKLIRIDDSKFWGGSKQQQRDDIKKRLRNTFELGATGHPTFSMSLQQAMPLIHESDSRSSVRFDVTLFYLDEAAGSMQYVVEGRLVVSADNSDAADSASSWWVEAIDMESGRTPPMPSMQTRRPPPMPDKNGFPRQ